MAKQGANHQSESHSARLQTATTFCCETDPEVLGQFCLSTTDPKLVRYRAAWCARSLQRAARQHATVFIVDRFSFSRPPARSLARDRQPVQEPFDRRCAHEPGQLVTFTARLVRMEAIRLGEACGRSCKPQTANRKPQTANRKPQATWPLALGAAGRRFLMLQPRALHTSLCKKGRDVPPRQSCHWRVGHTAYLNHKPACVHLLKRSMRRNAS